MCIGNGESVFYLYLLKSFACYTEKALMGISLKKAGEKAV
jgi:hypothetical protein